MWEERLTEEQHEHVDRRQPGKERQERNVHTQRKMETRRVFTQKAEAAAEAHNGADVHFSRCDASPVLCGWGGGVRSGLFWFSTLRSGCQSLRSVSKIQEPTQFILTTQTWNP